MVRVSRASSGRVVVPAVGGTRDSSPRLFGSVRRDAAARLDGVVLRPGETLSFWYLVGEPSRARGFQEGMELRSGCIVPSPGGGLCQIAGAVFEVALCVGLTVVEHHAHSLEIAPEHDRIRPFGAAA